jgi:tetratricopeptide (TPR) repeat protein
MARGKSGQSKLWHVDRVIASVLFILLGSSSRVDPAQGVDRVHASTMLPAAGHSSQLLAQKERRIALVIGNGAYSEGGKLQNPPNDATDMNKALKQLGFDVTLVLDGDQRQIEEEINKFNFRLRQGGVGLFYYAGHGVQVNGENYLIPIGANISREQDVPYEAVPLGKVLGAMEDAKNSINFVLIDACRNNPYSRGWRSSSRGLAFVQSVQGTLISFATAPGQVAADGDAQNSPYTASLLQHIQDPGVPVEVLFKNVRKSVFEKTGGKQTTWESTSLTGDFAFKPSSNGTSPLPEEANSSEMTAESLFKRAKEKEYRGDKQGAIADYDQALTLTDLAEAYKKQGAIRSDLGDKQGAIADFNQAAKFEFNRANIYGSRGLLRSELGDKQGAMADFNQSIKLKPDFAGLYNNRGLLRSELGDKQGAMADFNQAIKLQPDLSLAYNNRGNYRSELGDKQGAMADFNQLIKLRPNHYAYFSRGLLRSELGDKQGAIADYGQVIKLKPGLAGAYINRGLLRSDLGDKQGAIADYDQVIKLKPDYADAYFSRGNVRSDLGDKQGAMADYDQAIKLKPDYADAYFSRGNVRSDLGDKQGAIADYQKATDLYPSDDSWRQRAIDKIKKLQ